MDRTLPFPQADRLTTVATVVDAIAAGCDTSDSIATALGMSGRQGSYYPNAARYLGLVDVDETTRPMTWTLTAAGQDLLDGDDTARAELLAAAVADLDELDLVTRPGGADQLRQHLADTLGEDTITRRLQTLAAWSEFFALTAREQAAALHGSRRETARFAPAAAQALAVTRREQDRARTDRVGDICPGCFTVMSLAGTCDTCA